MTTPVLNAQSVGNVGLYYVCYRLSRAGWNVMPTSRNARGVDLIAYSQDAETKLAIQVKALTARAAVPIGSHRNNIFGDYWIICRGAQSDDPACFILTPAEVLARVHEDTSPKDGKVSYWLEPKDYESEAFKGWDRIGSGLGTIGV